MKKKILSAFIAAVLAFSMALPVFAAKVDDYPLLKSNFNSASVENNPWYPINVTISSSESVLIQSITTYHWNYGGGKTPGKISIWEGQEKIGEWQAAGRSGSGVDNILWDVFPNITLEPGHTYEIVDSDPETWSQNEESGHQGFCEIRGTFTTQNAGGSGSSSSEKKVSSWAEAEIKKAESIGLVPKCLKDKNLTKSITRAEFAAVTVELYEHMTSFAAPQESTPLKDISNHALKDEIEQAYTLNFAMGVSDTKFDPDASLNREQMASMLCRVIKKFEYQEWVIENDSDYQLRYNMPARFSDDSKISSWAKDSVYFMVACGIISGVGDNKFSPGGTATREQALAIAVRVFDSFTGEAQG